MLLGAACTFETILQRRTSQLFWRWRGSNLERHFVLVSGRMLVEALFLSVGLILLCGSLFWFGMTLTGLSCLSVGLRVRSLWPSMQRLRKMSVNYPLLRTIWFEYSTKVWGMWGYVKGWLNGSKQCSKTRRRLWSNPS